MNKQAREVTKADLIPAEEYAKNRIENLIKDNAGTQKQLDDITLSKTVTPRA